MSNSMADTQAQVELARQNLANDPENENLKLALADQLSALSSELADQDKSVEALEIAMEGTDIYRYLAEADPARFAIPLASALNIVSVRLYEAGYEAEGQSVASESARLARELLNMGQEEARFVLVSALVNQASRHWLDNKSAEGLATLTEAVQLYRAGGNEMVQFLGAIIDAMHRNALLLSERGEWQDAIAIRRLTLELFESDRPAQIYHLLAMTLMQGAYALSGNDRSGEALGLSEEALEIARSLDNVDSEKYRLFLAQALAALASRQHEAGAHPEALEVAVEAVNVFQEIAHINPAIVITPLTATLETFASILNSLGYEDQAKNILEQRDELTRSLAPQH